METNQIKLLKDLARNIKAEKRNKASIITSLQSAKILTKNENFTGHLKMLDRLFKVAD